MSQAMVIAYVVDPAVAPKKAAKPHETTSRLKKALPLLASFGAVAAGVAAGGFALSGQFDAASNAGQAAVGLFSISSLAAAAAGVLGFKNREPS